MNYCRARLRPAAIGLAAAALSFSLAHAGAPLRLTGSEPARNSHVDWPKQVHLHFNEKLASAGASVEMIRPDGEQVPMEPAIASSDDKSLVAGVKVPTLAGPYMVMWRAQPEHGPAAKGDFTFFVR